MQRTYYENDTIQSIANYAMNLLNGDYKEYYRNGVLKISGKYLNGQKEGDWIEYDETGNRVRTTRYKAGGKVNHEDTIQSLRIPRGV